MAVPGGPTGTVFNGGTGFQVLSTARPRGPIHLRDLEGTILGWPGAACTTATVDGRRQLPGAAVYKGLAIYGNTLYATDFTTGASTSSTALERRSRAGGVRGSVPAVVPAFAPFGIQQIERDIFVTYAKQQAGTDHEVHGRGLGIVDEYSPTGEFQHRVGASAA